jgi:hypothetical protein
MREQYKSKQIYLIAEKECKMIMECADTLYRRRRTPFEVRNEKGIKMQNHVLGSYATNIVLLCQGSTDRVSVSDQSRKWIVKD